MNTPPTSRLIWFASLPRGDLDAAGIYLDPFYVESVRDRPDLKVTDAALIGMQSGATHLVHETPQRAAERINLARSKSDVRVDYKIKVDTRASARARTGRKKAR